MSTAVLVEGISKQYRLGTLSGTTALADVRRWWRRARGLSGSSLSQVTGDTTQLHSVEKEVDVSRPDEYIWALRDVSFRVLQGEAVGIIGRNGAGKSTLLKILSRVTAPTTGEIKAKGRISSLLEVGTGFHPELTGRENTFLNGAILGMSRAEVRRKFDEIVDFSGVEQFIDTPVKRYSSGMYVRLAFAVAAHLEPEILVVDEVLAVGDTAFQKKCLGKMEDVAHAGRTVLFVSHNMSAVADLCSTAFWLEKGRIVATGSARSVVAAYLSKVVEPRRIRTWPDMRNAPGNDTVRLVHAEIEAESGHDPDYWTVDTPLVMTFRFRNSRPDLPLHAEVKLFTKDGICAFQSASKRARHAEGILEAKCRLPARLLNDGSYSVTFSVHFVGTEGVAAEAVLAFETNDVPRDIFPADKWPGVLRPELVWSIDELGTVAE
jgi:lipopolysaccharide transport system ATP-binding protein